MFQNFQQEREGDQIEILLDIKFKQYVRELLLMEKFGGLLNKHEVVLCIFL